MRWILLTLLLIWAQVSMASGPDEMILGPRYLPGFGATGFVPVEVCRAGLRAQFLHADPYGSNDFGELGWSFAAMEYGAGRWGAFGRFRSYGLEGLYQDNSFVLGGALSPARGVSVSLSTTYEREEFGGENGYQRLDLGFSTSYTRSGAVLTGRFERLNLKKPYDFDGITTPDFGLSGSYSFDNGITLGVGYDNPGLGPGRLSLAQRADLVDMVGLKLGFMNNPDLLFWGLDLSYKKLTLDFTYIAIGRLNDTMVLGLSYGER